MLTMSKGPKAQKALIASRLIILLCIYALAFMVRLFSVIRWESIIHEFDPYFNFRTTKKLLELDFYEWWNWFDTASWYPLGRVVGQTLYPGLMLTAYTIHKILTMFGLLFDIRDICVFTGPIFAGLTAIAGYFLTKETTNNELASFLAALFLSISPSYISRSVAGSFDNEAVAIFALVFVFYAYVRAINRGTVASAVFASFAYLYMSTSWGGYVFVTNVIALHAGFVMLLGQFTLKYYVAYSIFYVIGTLMCLNIPFINFQAITATEHFLSHCVFIAAQLTTLHRYVKRSCPEEIQSLTKYFYKFCIVIIFSVAGGLIASGKTRWSGRVMSLLDPTYATKYIPIIASVSEHQASTWTMFVFDLDAVIFFVPISLLKICSNNHTPSMFLALYGLLAVYFSSIMIRLVLILAPAACCLGAIGIAHVVENPLQIVISEIKNFYKKIIQRNQKASNTDHQKDIGSLTDRINKFSISMLLLIILFIILTKYITHSVFVASQIYSHPSIVLENRMQGGQRIILDDFREAYYWMRKNTHSDAKLMSWWDYGYQSAYISNRTVIVDNNTWNTSHIATVGLALSSPEEKAYKIVSHLDVDYVFVIYGGYLGYSSDDINKMYWMINIAAGVYPEMKLLIQKFQSSTRNSELTNTLLYKLSYYNLYKSTSTNYDRLRGGMVPKIDTLKYFKEVYSSVHYLVRIYEVNRPQYIRASVEAAGINEL